MAEKTLEEIKADILHRAGRINPFERVKLEDVQQVVSRLSDFEPDPWGKQWGKLGLKYEALAEEQEKQGRSKEAGETYYLAYEYFRIGRYPVPSSPEKMKCYKGALRTFLKAAPTMTHRVRYNPYLHTAQAFHMMVEALAFAPRDLMPFDMKSLAVDDAPPAFLPTESEVVQAKDIVLEAARIEPLPPLVLLNPNCSDMLPLRRWPTEKYIELAQRLTAAYPELYVGVTGSPSEAKAAASMVERIGSKHCFSLAGRTTLRQLLVIFGLADVLVTNDSGPAHFAALTPIDVVTLFGPETPQLYGARTPRNHVFWQALACSPCVSALNQKFSACRNNLCMQHIDVDAVFNKVCKIYQTKRNTRTFANGENRVRHVQLDA